jgi:hypothetical protein
MDPKLIMIDIDALIEPGKASAGFFLGQSLADVRRRIDLSGMKTWSRVGGDQLAYSIKNTADWLRVPVSEVSDGKFGGEVWHYSHGMVELHFGKAGTLFDISVFEGYRGSLRGAIKLGMLLTDLENICPLFYNDAEEVYVPMDVGDLSGVGFYIDESKSVPLVHGISVFDISFDE